METAIVAGVGPGLGASLARAFAWQGYALALLSRGPETSTRVAEEIRLGNGKALVVQTDVSRAESVKRAIEQVRFELGQITALATMPAVTVAALS